MDESMAYGVPGIFIPIKNHFEQEECAKRLGYNYRDISRIDTLIEEKLSSEGNTIGNNNNGAEKAAKLILKLLWPYMYGLCMIVTSNITPEPYILACEPNTI